MKKFMISTLLLLLAVSIAASALAWIHPNQMGTSGNQFSGSGSSGQQSGYTGSGGSGGGGQNMPTPYIPVQPTARTGGFTPKPVATPKTGGVPVSAGGSSTNNNVTIPAMAPNPTGHTGDIPALPTPNTARTRVGTGGWINNQAPDGAEITMMVGGASPKPGATTTTTITTVPGGNSQVLDWYGVGFDLINANKSITVYDVNTGVTWNGTYINGRNHADVVPASANDAALLSGNNITGSYVRRPVIVTIAGGKYAGSLYAVGHGSTNYVSHFRGVMCIHFTGSKTHGTGKVDTDHQEAINSALTSGQ